MRDRNNHETTKRKIYQPYLYNKQDFKRIYAQIIAKTNNAPNLKKLDHSMIIII